MTAQAITFRGTTTSSVFLVAGILFAALTEALTGTLLALGRADIIDDTAATPDEFSWLDVGYVALKLLGFVTAPWLMTRFRPRNLLLTVTLLIGAAAALPILTTALGPLIVMRVVQGFAGGVILVTGQAMLFADFPTSRQPMLQALFAIGAVVAPATLAPALTGWLIDAHSWLWFSSALVALSLFAAGMLVLADTNGATIPARPFDAIGFSLIAITFGCFSFVLGQGSRWDWFEAPRIVWATVFGSAALLAFLAQQVRAGRKALLDWQAFRSNDFVFAFLVSFVAGAALFGSAFLIPSFAMSVLSFTPGAAGQLLLPGSALFIAALFVAAWLFQYRRVPPIATVPPGILLIMLAMAMLSGSTRDSGTDDLALPLLLRALGLGFLFLSITLIAFGQLGRRSLASGIGMFDAGRQLGGLIGVAGLQTLIDREVVDNLTVIGAHLTAASPVVGERLAATSGMLAAAGFDAATAGRAAAGLLGRAASGQAAVLAFDSAFAVVALMFVFAVPLLVACRVVIDRATKARALRKSRSLAAVAPLTMLAACTVGPDFRSPDVPVRNAWIASVDVSDVDGEWWRKLNDPLLDELVGSAIAGNRDLREAGARLREVRAQRDTIRSRALPQVAVAAAATENRLSENGLLPVANIPGFDAEFPLRDIGFEVSWEIDLFGGTRRAVEAADARGLAAEEARHGVALQIIAETVRAYVDLRTAQNLRANVAADAEAQFELARIVADRRRVGVASEFDLVRARAQAESTAAAIPGLESDAAAAAIRLALLSGEYPETLHDRLLIPQPLPGGDLNVSVGLRADLLRRRPDVRQAELALAAATADIGVATAELFPRFTLLGGVGQQARSADDLWSSESRRFQFGPAFRWPIFAGGRLRAQVRAADARAEAALIRYEHAVASALADSETQINRFVSSNLARARRDGARREAETAVALARARYLAGEDDLTALLVAQSAFSAADRLSLQARAGELQQLAALYKALGGGWNAADIADRAKR
jgi:DHA2 family multidrug resistance protein